jgi:cell wall-associated NlpC family hydrolase
MLVQLLSPMIARGLCGAMSCRKKYAPAAVAAVAVLAGACASSGAVPRPFPLPAHAAPPAATTGDAIVMTALALRGRPYLSGGSTPRGFDCSGFTQYVFAQHGIALPREVRDQFERGTPVQANAIVAGDLLFFSTTAPGASHVAIAIGGNEFVHAPSSTGVVRVDRLGAPYWARHFVGAMRVE